VDKERILAKLDEMETDVRELIFMMNLSEKSLSSFFENEPNIYKEDKTYF